MLQKGIGKFRDVIDEAKETHSIAAIRKLFPKEFAQQIDDQEQIINEYRRVEEALKNDEKLQDELKKVESRDAGNLLNFLERQLHRLEGEKREHAMYLLAERERYSREAAAMGKREFEEQFRNDAITLYLENILLEGVHRAATSGEESREVVRRMARKIDRRASKSVSFDEREEERESSNESNTEDVSESSSKAAATEALDEKVVMELLKENMMPKIMSKIKNEQLLAQQKKHLMSAHHDLFKDELEAALKQAEREVCVDILEEMFAKATSADGAQYLERTVSEESAEAEVLAGQSVELILSEIAGGEIEFSSTSTAATFSSNGSYDGDGDGDTSNLLSTTDTDSTTDRVAAQVVRDILSEIIFESFSSTTEFTTESQSDC